MIAGSAADERRKPEPPGAPAIERDHPAAGQLGTSTHVFLC